MTVKIWKVQKIQNLNSVSRERLANVNPYILYVFSSLRSTRPLFIVALKWVVGESASIDVKPADNADPSIMKSRNYICLPGLSTAVFSIILVIYNNDMNNFP